MTKVKVQTALASNFGHTVDFNNIHLHFDRLGFAEVDSQEIAEGLAKNYPDWLFVGEAPIPGAKKVSNNTEVSDLQQEVERLKEKVIDREATIKAVEDECKEWKKQLDKHIPTADKTITDLKAIIVQKDKDIKELELKVQLTKKNVKDLTDFCNKLEIPEERFKGKTKDEIIIIILDESRNK